MNQRPARNVVAFLASFAMCSLGGVGCVPAPDQAPRPAPPYASADPPEARGPTPPSPCDEALARAAGGLALEADGRLLQAKDAADNVLRRCTDPTARADAEATVARIRNALQSTEDPQVLIDRALELPVGSAERRRALDVASARAEDESGEPVAAEFRGYLPKQERNGAPGLVVWSADGELVARIVGERISIREASRRFRETTVLSAGVSPELLAFSADGSQLAVIDKDDTLHVFDRATWTRRGGNDDPDPDPQAGYAAYAAGTPFFGNPPVFFAACRCRFECVPDQANSLLFSPEGRHIVATSDYGTVRVWEAETMHQLAVWKTWLLAPLTSFRGEGEIFLEDANVSGLDDKLFAIGKGPLRRADELWDFTRGRLKWRLRSRGKPERSLYSCERKRLESIVNHRQFNSFFSMKVRTSRDLPFCGISVAEPPTPTPGDASPNVVVAWNDPRPNQFETQFSPDGKLFGPNEADTIFSMQGEALYEASSPALGSDADLAANLRLQPVEPPLDRQDSYRNTVGDFHQSPDGRWTVYLGEARLPPEEDEVPNDVYYLQYHPRELPGLFALFRGPAEGEPVVESIGWSRPRVTFLANGTLVAIVSGVASYYSRDGRVLATVRVFTDGTRLTVREGSFETTSGPRPELDQLTGYGFGQVFSATFSTAQAMRCRAGRIVLPFEACEDRRSGHNLLSNALTEAPEDASR